MPLAKDQDTRFHIREPDYSTVIPPMQLRRMSRLLKMGVYCGMDCIRKAGIARPDGIITGTGKGSMTDTEKFVKELRAYQEEAMNPTPFILSTYNAINGAIALQTGATGYNQTFVHRGSSFEVSLYDAQLKLHSATAPQHYLAGCFDEITEEYFFVKEKIGYWKQARDPEQSLWAQSDSPGSIAGEGAAFFMLSNQPDHALLGLQQVQTFTARTPEKISGSLQNALHRQEWDRSDIDLLVLGLNGDSRDEPYYREALALFDTSIPVLGFKNLCGEYETAGGFALWLTCCLLQGTPLPEEAWHRQPRPGQVFRRILYYNHYRGQNHNLMLLSA